MLFPIACTALLLFILLLTRAAHQIGANISEENIPSRASKGPVDAMSLIKVATCQLDQWALDFDANLERVKKSMREAKAQGAAYRLGPELELSGYGCEDHFLEPDTMLHCAESLADLLSSDLTDGMLCDVGLPAMHRGVRYNCRALLLDRQVLLMRPKMAMADDGNYRETRYFSCWPRDRALEDWPLPPCVAAAANYGKGQTVAPFGYAVVEALGSVFGVETCEELWTPDAPHIAMALAGCEVIGNGSGSHHQLRKLDTRVNLITSASSKAGGVYLYSNQRGCDGGRLYFDGGALVVQNGRVLQQAPQFSVCDVEVLVATVDLDEVRTFRAATSSAQAQAAEAGRALAVPRVVAPASPHYKPPPSFPASVPTSPQLGGAKYALPEEECAYGPACWLWDYLRRSGAGGFFLPLSGGADSGATCAIVGAMCELVAAECRKGNAQVTADARRVCGANSNGNGDGKLDVSDPKVLAACVLHTCYMGTSHSSSATRHRASALATEVGAHHCSLEIDVITDAVVSVFSRFVSNGRTPEFVSRGGTLGEDLALQNIQARVRMVLSYLCAQLLPWVRGRSGFLLVLGSANVDEALRGYMTKYDCSSADVNPIGSISKGDLKRLLVWAASTFGYSALRDIENAAPTAELRPDTSEGLAQTDEDDMGMSYEELGWFGRLRKIEHCGPVTMFKKLTCAWADKCTPTQVATKVKFFFKMYGINRHKMTTLTPSYHAESYSPCDNRFDLRPFLYHSAWPRQNHTIDQLAAEYEANLAQQAK